MADKAVGCFLSSGACPGPPLDRLGVPLLTKRNLWSVAHCFEASDEKYRPPEVPCICPLGPERNGICLGLPHNLSNSFTALQPAQFVGLVFGPKRAWLSTTFCFHFASAIARPKLAIDYPKVGFIYEHEARPSVCRMRVEVDQVVEVEQKCTGQEKPNLKSEVLRMRGYLVVDDWVATDGIFK
ncbi:hypothetical protein B0H19DRAFT_1056400 [Mycena capillaripes]|nr:hypothetical protein B0H19DRAFT_1056400 [Mycena capillaripes]